MGNVSMLANLPDYPEGSTRSRLRGVDNALNAIGAALDRSSLGEARNSFAALQAVQQKLLLDGPARNKVALAREDSAATARVGALREALEAGDVASARELVTSLKESVGFGRKLSEARARREKSPAEHGPRNESVHPNRYGPEMRRAQIEARIALARATPASTEGIPGGGPRDG